jgi:hypothetical protein
VRVRAAVNWVIQVVDSARAAVADAHIYQIIDGAATELGRTGTDGLFRTGALKSGDEIAAAYPRTITKFVKVPDSENRYVTIQLAEAGEVRGRTVFKGAGIPNITVLAAPSLPAKFEISVVERALAGDPTIPCAKTGADGRFTIGGLDPQLTYTLLAGGAGYGMPGMRPLVPVSSATEIELGVYPVFGAAIHLVAADGNPIKSGSNLFSAAIGQTAYPPGKVMSFGARGPIAVLLGVPADIAKKDSPDWILLGQASDEEVESVGPLKVSTPCVGYESPSVSLDLPRLRGDYLVREVRMTRTAEAFANVTVELRDLPQIELSAEERAKRRIVGTIEFRAKKGTGVIYHIWSPNDGRLRIEGVPYGLYDVCFTTGFGFHCGATKEVSIRDPEVAFALSVLPKDNDDVGSLVIRPKRPNGEEYTGRLTVALRKGRDNATSNVTFLGSPYVFEMLPAKKLQLTVIPEVPRVSGLPEYLKYDVDIQSHRQTTLDVAMTR